MSRYIQKVGKLGVKEPVGSMLTKNDKNKLIADFVEIMGRRPTKLEMFTLLEEEVKIRQGKKE